MARIVDKTEKGGKLSKPQLRALDFLEHRIDRGVEEGLEPEKSDTISRGASTSTKPIESPAAYLFQQLELFRERQKLDRDQAAIDFRSARDLAVAGRRNWVPIGPAGVERGQAATNPVVSGRAKGIAVAPGSQRVYIATANGGAWYSGNTGKTWTPLMNGLDFFPNPLNTSFDEGVVSLACGAIALVPGSGHSDDRLYIGTGEGDGMTDAYLGVGPLVSDNGGSSWRRETANPTLFGKGFYALAVDPDDPQRVVAGTSAGVFVREPDGAGAYQWNRKAFDGKRVSGLVVAKGRSGKRFFAAIWGEKVYASENGNTWSPIETNFPSERIGRIAIAVNPHNPDILYAQIACGDRLENPTPANPQFGHLLGLYRFDYTIDQKWHKVSGAPATLFGPDLTEEGQGDYDNALIVAPNNENRVYVGGSTVDSGGNWVAAIYRLKLVVLANGSATVIPPVKTIGEDVHADVHGFAFAPNDPEKLWVACDGGIFYSNKAASGTGRIFEERNKGLQTLTMNYIGTYPGEEEVLFGGAQDNGGLRYIGEDIWLHSLPGDAGYYLVNWAEPNRVIDTYALNNGFRSDNGGNRMPNLSYDYHDWSVTLDRDPDGNEENLLFYAPLAQVPPPDVINPGDPAQLKQARILAFGTQRPWISTDFGVNWLPIPSRTLNNPNQFLADRNLLNPDPNFIISALTFQDSRRLLVGLTNGKVFRYTDTSANNDWSTLGPVTELSALPGGPLPSNAVTDFALRPGHPNEFYIAYGGIISGADGYRHIWHFNGAQWQHLGGAAGRQLLNVHYNAIIAVTENQLFAGSDVGVWKSEDGGAHWDTFSFGLPETAIMDLQLSKRDLGGGNMLLLLRASTYGRGVYEYQIAPAPPAPAPGISVDVGLFLRDHLLDKGRYPTRLNIPDPRNAGTQITTVDTPDIKVAIPDGNGVYPFPPGLTPSPGDFYLSLEDKSNQVPVPSGGRAISKVYVQVHNRGAFPAQHVYVMLLICEHAGGPLPQLPAGYEANLRAGIPITGDGWKTVGFQLARGMFAANPKVVTFDLPSELLPTHASIGAGKDLILVALLHHVDDAYSSNNRVIDPTVAGNVILSDEKKIAFKRITAKQSAPIPSIEQLLPPLAGFVAIPDTATAAGAPYDAFLAQAFRQNDELLQKAFLSAFCAPTASRGSDAIPLGLDAGTLLNAIQINVDAPVTLKPGVPLIWQARNRIVISQKINGKGKGAPINSDGDFGGSGGGSPTTSGKQCSIPMAIPTIVIAASAINAAGQDLNPIWASRATLMLPSSKGAGAGGSNEANAGGLGGGIVVLSAPVIEFSGNGEIDVSGETGNGNAGSGGGGLVILVAGEIIGLRDNGPNPNVVVLGGQPGAGSTGSAGGKGLLIKKTIT